MRESGLVISGTMAALAGILGAAAVLHARETTRPLPPSTARVMYLQSGRVADRLFLSFDALAADVYWIRTIQHYGRDRKSSRGADRFQLLQPLLDLTTTLDSRFNIAYRFGAIFLSMEWPNGPARPDQAIALLEKGLSANPLRWQYAHDIGFIHYWYTRDYAAAARWFERAAAMPGAPEWIGPLAALTRAQGGDRQGARRLLRELLTADEPYIQSAARRSLAQLDALDVMDTLAARIGQFQSVTGRYPSSWSDLVRARLLPGIPVDPTNVPYAYDPEMHAVGLAHESSLNPLPQGLSLR